MDFDMVTTKGGDRGESSLADGERRVKDDPLFEAMGDVDELSSFLGLVRVESSLTRTIDMVHQIQEDLLRVGAEIAAPPHSKMRERIHSLVDEDIERLESWESELLRTTEIKPVFILPGDSRASAYLDVARAVARRSERGVVSCIRGIGRSDLAMVQRYLNRLSDLLFIMARAESSGASAEE